MKIVHIEDFFHPDAGYQVNILTKYMVKHGFEISIITAEMDLIPASLSGFFGKDNVKEHDRLFEQEFGVKIVRIPAKRYISGRVIFSSNLLLRTIRLEKPDMVYVHGNDTYTGMWVILHAKKLGYPVITDSHMVAIASNNRFRKLFYLFYRIAIAPIIKKEMITVIRTTSDNYVNKYLGVPLEQSPVISFGSDTMLFHPDIEVKHRFRNEYNISKEAFVIIYAGKLDEAKGGDFLASLTCEDFETNKEIVFLVVGNTVGEYGEKVEKHLSTSKYRIVRLPTQKYSELAPLYQSADLALIPRQCSLSFFDLQACGLPILAEDNSINVSRLSYQNGWVFHKDSIDDFKANLEKILNMNNSEFSSIARNAYNLVIEQFNYNTKSTEYEQVIMKAYTYKKYK